MVPGVVGSSPIFHPHEGNPGGFPFFRFRNCRAGALRGGRNCLPLFCDKIDLSYGNDRNKHRK